MRTVSARQDGDHMPHDMWDDLPVPCEPVDIDIILERLHRSRRLRPEHLQVLHDFGRKFRAPHTERPHERKSHHLWREAMRVLEPVLQRRGIIRTFFKQKETL